MVDLGPVGACTLPEELGEAAEHRVRDQRGVELGRALPSAANGSSSSVPGAALAA